ncbi:MAG: NAD(P)-binding domain-containing protein [Planctomycetota bacterium]
MSFFAILPVFALFVLVLSLLGFWQYRIGQEQRTHALAEIEEARDRGTDKPLAQHPLIDVQACIGCGSCVAVCPEEGVLGLVNGVAHIINGVRCIGHARCAEVCPVNALSIGLGDISKRTDIPTLSDDLETSVPGIHIAGELGGFALIRIAVEQGTRAMDSIAESLGGESRPARAADNVADVLIVGAGPAGIAAALRAKELRLHSVTIDQDDIGGTVRKYPRRKLTLTGSLVLPLYGRVKREEFLKEELIEFWEDLIAEQGLRINTGVKLLGIDATDVGFEARTSAGPVRARRVLLALGRRGTPRRLGVPGEESERVLYQLIDAATFRNERILVVGGGDSAVEAATALANQPGNHVTLSYRRAHFTRLKSRNLERIERYMKHQQVQVIFDSDVTEIETGAVRLVRRENGTTRTVQVAADYVFVLVGGEPPYPLLREMGVRFTGDSAGSPLTSAASAAESS